MFLHVQKYININFELTIQHDYTLQPKTNQQTEPTSAYKYKT